MWDHSIEVKEYMKVSVWGEIFPSYLLSAPKKFPTFAPFFKHNVCWRHSYKTKETFIFSFTSIATLNHMNHPYKLIAVDLDGTLVKSNQSISQHTIETLVRAQEAGIKVAVASGRPTFGTQHAANALRLNEFGGYIMSYNGGEIYDWQQKKLIYSKMLDKQVIPYIYTYAQEHGMGIMTYIGSEVVSEVEDNPYIFHSSMRNRMPIRLVPDFVTAAQEADVVKCIIVGDPIPLQEMEKELQKALKGQANVFRSEPFFLEIVPLGIDKAKGLEILLSKIGLCKEELMAFGDGYNDTPMLAYAGLGIAMGNAHDEIKKAADFVTLSNEDDGVAFAVEKFILQDKPY